MTSIKMIIALVGSLIVLGIFSAGFSPVHQEVVLKTCSNESKISDVNAIDFTCFNQQTTTTTTTK
jgi:hypothetical protein